MTKCMMGCGLPAWACKKCIELACEKSADYAITANEKIVRASAKEAAEGVLGEVFRRLEAVTRECDAAMVRAATAEHEVARWRKGNPSDDLWRVRMEQAETDNELLRDALMWARSCLPAVCFDFENDDGVTLGDMMAAALKVRR